MSEFRNVIDKALQKAGGVRALAKALKCSPSTISNWNAGGQPKGPLVDALRNYVSGGKATGGRSSMLAEDSASYIVDDKPTNRRLLEENRKLKKALEEIRKFADEAIIRVQL